VKHSQLYQWLGLALLIAGIILLVWSLFS
jgi:hypothetical protein